MNKDLFLFLGAQKERKGERRIYHPGNRSSPIFHQSLCTVFDMQKSIAKRGNVGVSRSAQLGNELSSSSDAIKKGGRV